MQYILVLLHNHNIEREILACGDEAPFKISVPKVLILGSKARSCSFSPKTYTYLLRTTEGIDKQHIFFAETA